MGSYSPHRFANSRNPIIVVGPVARSGQYPFTSWVVGARTDSANGPEPFLKGEYTVHALGVDVEIIDEFTPDSYIRGTSPALAVPQIAGLAAYILTLPGLRWPPGSVSKLVKDWIVSKKRHGPDIPGPISPDGEDVAYNDAYNILQRCVPGSNLYGPPQFVGRPAEFPNDAPGQPPQSLPPVVNQEPPNVGPPGRRWSADFSTLSNILRRVYKRQPKAQERKVQETLIFENDHLTDPKYSNQVSPPDGNLHPFIVVLFCGRRYADGRSDECSFPVNCLGATSQHTTQSYHFQLPTKRASRTPSSEVRA